jgi:Tfp pilus assembly protein PilX
MPDGKNYYRITVRGYGVNADTQVTLQEIYFKE